MRPETFAAMAETAAVCEHLHYPLQSGSDRVLALMHRGYTAERYLTRLADARATIDDLAVSTDIIVGFPGETEGGLRTRRSPSRPRLEYDYAYTFIFSPREDRGGVDGEGRLRRTRRSSPSDSNGSACVVGSDRALRRHRGTESDAIEEVLVEGPSKRGPSGHPAAGRAQNTLVHFVPPRPLRTGSYATVEITRGPALPRGHLRRVHLRTHSQAPHPCRSPLSVRSGK